MPLSLRGCLQKGSPIPTGENGSQCGALVRGNANIRWWVLNLIIMVIAFGLISILLTLLKDDIMDIMM